MEDTEVPVSTSQTETELSLDPEHSRWGLATYQRERGGEGREGEGREGEGEEREGGEEKEIKGRRERNLREGNLIALVYQASP